MRKIIVVIILGICAAAHARAATPESCADQGKSYVRSSIDYRGYFRAGYCRHSKKAQRVLFNQSAKDGQLVDIRTGKPLNCSTDMDCVIKSGIAE